MILVVYKSEALVGTEEALRRGRIAFERLIKQHAA
jgi:hypothetical protein